MFVIELDGNKNAKGHPIGIDNFRALFPNTSFPKIITPAALSGYSYGCYEFAPQPECPRGFKVVEIAPQKADNGIYYQSYKVVEMTEEEKEHQNLQKATEVRWQRNRVLAATDWLVIKHLELNENIPEAWAAYRQALRDVPQQAGFPWEIVWPTQPE